MVGTTEEDVARCLAVLARELGVESLSIDALRDSLHAPMQRTSGSHASSDSGHSGPEEAGANQQKQNCVPNLRTAASAPDLVQLPNVAGSVAAPEAVQKKAHMREDHVRRESTGTMSESFNARLKSGFRRATRRLSLDGVCHSTSEKRSLSNLGDSSNSRSGIWENLSGFQAQEETSSHGLWESCGLWDSCGAFWKICGAFFRSPFLKNV